jgi:nucleotide-binding universal stress UspA family protein
MFRHLLVPLDGSRLAECALPAAALCARSFGAELTLVHVIERNPPARAHGEHHLRTREEAVAYLSETARVAMLAGLRVRTHVHEAAVEDVARAITEHSQELSPDLVVMSTHGRGGARRLVLGDIAQQVVAQGGTPVLLVRVRTAGRQATLAGGFNTILAPIDGDPSHEQSLPVAAELARAFGARLDLLMVVPTPGKLSGTSGAVGRLMPSAVRVMLEMDHDAATAHLEARALSLAQQGIPVTHETVRNDPAAAIIQAARSRRADLVVMATHGRAGTEAFWAGSIASKVIARLSAPVLLVPLPGASGKPSGRGEEREA